MTEKTMISPDYLFEISWEVCNKIGGIHTVLSTKAYSLSKNFKKKHILIGPDVYNDIAENKEFEEDPNMLRAWRAKAAEEGLRIRVGRWKIPSDPIAILVDFSTFRRDKDVLFGEFWSRYNVDSLSCIDDYEDSFLFGYAAGKVVESYAAFNLSNKHKIVAQFHEWNSGAGILYLKSLDIPVASVFTSHATVLGRSIAGNTHRLYDNLYDYNPDTMAIELNVKAKHSLEKAIAQNADIYTTVSRITADECAYFLGKRPDIITPNGFEFELLEDYSGDVGDAREALINLASAMTGEEMPKDSFIVATSGRYEFYNKGIDLFMDSLKVLSLHPDLDRTVLAFIFVPAANSGPNRELLHTQITHHLKEPGEDLISKKIQIVDLLNRSNDKVKLFFVPSYLNGNDGVLNIPYYGILKAIDLTVFPSYYEPWGYTPLESLAFGVPTITTTLSGFGLWIKEFCADCSCSATVIERHDSNYDQALSGVMNKILEMSKLDPIALSEYKNNAIVVAQSAQWHTLIKYYKEAYSTALEKIPTLFKFEFDFEMDYEDHIDIKTEVSNIPNWTKLMIDIQLPDRVQFLNELSRNLWWCWNQSAIDLFSSIDANLWLSTKGNPIVLLDEVSKGRFEDLVNDEIFLEKLDAVEVEYRDYMAKKEQMKSPAVAYFSMEYGLDQSLKIYSGGLGILAGDYLKESSDKMVKMTGVGLLYRYGYFNQTLSSQGDQVAQYEAQNFTKIPAAPVRDSSGNWVKISIALPGRNLYARLWRVDVGRTELILLDTDFEENLPEDMCVTHYLYGGDWENRLKQEILLGVGGIRALHAINRKVDVYHCNEGHAAFIGLERLKDYIVNDKLNFGEAMEAVRSSSLFTTHTPVPAGHDSFADNMLKTYFDHYPEKMGTTWRVLMALGKINPDDSSEKFSMSNLAANLSQEINGVSWLHGKVSQDVLSPLWPGYLPEELHVSYVTNGVHYPTWTAPEWKTIHAESFGSEFTTHLYDKSCFEGIYNVEDSRIWSVRKTLRKKLISYIREYLSNTEYTPHYSPKQVVAIKEGLRDDVLTIGFARRFATYKRAHLLFSDLDRLDKVVNNSEYPIQFVFAGKAHPADKAGQDLIKRIVQISLMPQFIGKIIFLPGYDMCMAKRLVQGVDVWMNTPTRPLEASGTSGEKAAMNGVMHFSVLDGWWVEGYKEGAGWSLPMESTYENNDFQNELDAATIYNMLENDIAPLFYNVNQATGLPEEWIRYIKNTIAQVASNFTTNRMITDYCKQYYDPLYTRYEHISGDNFLLARELAYWKRKVRREWSVVEVKKYIKPDNETTNITPYQDYFTEVEIYIGELKPEDIGVEMILALPDKSGRMIIKKRFDFKLESFDKGLAKFICTLQPDTAGVYNFAGRIYAKNPKLPHRQDFDLVKWL